MNISPDAQSATHDIPGVIDTRHMSARISLARARALYEGPPRRTLTEVARLLHCHPLTLRRRFISAGEKLRRPAPKLTVPPGTDPILETLMNDALNCNRSVADIEAFAGVGKDTLRMWYYCPRTGPRLHVVQQIAEVLGYRLALVPLEERRP